MIIGPAFLRLLEDQRITRMVIEHKDRATRFGFRFVEVLLRSYGRTLEVVNLADTDRVDLWHDLVSAMYSFAARQNAPTSGQEENGSDCRTTQAGGTRCS